MNQQHLTKFDVPDVIISVQARRKTMRRTRTWSKSSLTRFRSELVKLRKSGASLGDLQVWLHLQRCNVHRSTIHRYLAKLPELQNAQLS